MAFLKIAASVLLLLLLLEFASELLSVEAGLALALMLLVLDVAAPEALAAVLFSR